MVLDLESLPKTSGLYYFYHGSELLYIGKANKIKYRIKDHYNKSLFVESCIKILNDKLIPLYQTKQAKKLIENRQHVMMITTVIQSSQWIDVLFKKVNSVKTEEVNYNDLRQNEVERIQRLKPLFNIETRVENEEIIDLYEKCRHVNFYLLHSLGW